MANKQLGSGREAFWRDAIARQRASGLGVSVFCQQEKLTKSSFYAWRQTIKERDDEAKQRSSAVHVTKNSPAFVPALITGEPPSEAALVIRLACGRELRVPESVSPAWLGQVVRVLDPQVLDERVER